MSLIKRTKRGKRRTKKSERSEDIKTVEKISFGDLNPNAKINIILDLDNTLINSLTSDELKSLDKNKRNKFPRYSMDGIYEVFERPHLQEFLDYIFGSKDFRVSIWTAASKSYAIFIIKNIILTKPNRKLDFVLFSQHCRISQKKLNCIKDLSLLWDYLDPNIYTKDNTFIIDDLDEVQDENEGNVFPAHPFEVLDEGSENDKYLLDLIKEIKELKELKKEK